MTPIDENDWRLETQGNESYRGATFERRRWSERPGLLWSSESDQPAPLVWDHDHCAFCWAIFCVRTDDHPEFLEAGYRLLEPRTSPAGQDLDREGVLSKRFGGHQIGEPLEQETWVWNSSQ
jgi:hypothetical protein